MNLNPNGASDCSVNLENELQPVSVEARLLRTWPDLGR